MFRNSACACESCDGPTISIRFAKIVELRCLLQENGWRMKLAHDTHIPEPGLLHLCYQLDSSFNLDLIPKMQIQVMQMLEDSQRDTTQLSREVLKTIWELELKKPANYNDLKSAFEKAQGMPVVHFSSLPAFP